MKLSVAAVCLLTLVSFANGLSTIDIIKAVNQCKHENNCHENILQVIKRNEIPNSNEGLNSMYCAGVKVGMINADDTVNGEIMTTVLEKMHMDKDKASSIAAECKSSCAGSDHAEAAKSLLTCIKSHA